MKTILASVLVSCALVVACSSSDSTTGTPTAADACAVTDASKVVSISAPTGGASCPTFTPAQLNEPDDSGTTDCKPKIDKAACSSTINCTETDPDGTTTNLSGTLTKDGAVLKGKLTVVVTAPSAEGVTCTYDMSIQ